MAILNVRGTEVGPPPAFPDLLLCNPKFSGNVINVHRLAACFGVPQVWCTGSRVGPEPGRGRRTRIPPEERLRAYGAVDRIWCERAFEILRGSGAQVVGIEIHAAARSLPDFDHHAPDRAGRIVYVFGPEDSSLPAAPARQCDVPVQIPAHHCLDLATAVAAVLWDRTARLRTLDGLRGVAPVGPWPQVPAGPIPRPGQPPPGGLLNRRGSVGCTVQPGSPPSRPSRPHRTHPGSKLCHDHDMPPPTLSATQRAAPAVAARGPASVDAAAGRG